MTTALSPGDTAVHAKGASLMRKMASRITELEAENASLSEKVASYERGERVAKIASAMEEKGLNQGLTLQEKIASLSKEQDLDSIEAALDLVGPGEVKIASVTDDSPAHGSSAEDSTLAFFVTGHNG